MKRVIRNVEGASYGGAFDINDSQYFTREDVEAFMYEVVDQLSEEFPDHLIDIGEYGASIEPNNKLYIAIGLDDEVNLDYTVQIDMRRIRYPQDLVIKYVPGAVDNFKKQIQDYLDEIYGASEITHAVGTGYQYYDDGKSFVVEDNDGNLIASGFESEDDAKAYIQSLPSLDDVAEDDEASYYDNSNYVCYASDVAPNNDGSRLYWKKGGGVRWCTERQADRFSAEEADRICNFKGSHTWVRAKV